MGRLPHKIMWRSSVKDTRWIWLTHKVPLSMEAVMDFSMVMEDANKAR
jgi:hypothetical protein